MRKQYNFLDGEPLGPVIEDEGRLLITDALYRRLQKAGDIDGYPTASDYAPFVARPRVSMRDVSDWEIVPA